MTENLSIGEVAERFNLSVPTIRYYDKQGLLPELQKDATGNRIFTEYNIATLELIQCLKLAGMQIKDIKVFIKWCEAGDETLTLRKQMFENLKATLETKMQALNETLDQINFKRAYYTQAVADGTETHVKEMPAEKVLANFEKLKIAK